MEKLRKALGKLISIKISRTLNIDARNNEGATPFYNGDYANLFLLILF